jgi:hypothetical protein
MSDEQGETQSQEGGEKPTDPSQVPLEIVHDAETESAAAEAYHEPDQGATA